MNYREQIQELRERGYRVEVRHERLYVPGRGRRVEATTAAIPDRMLHTTREAHGLIGFMYPAVLSPKGGRTVVKIFHDGDPEPVVTGYAFCHLDDVYVKRFGTMKALGRAVQELIAKNVRENAAGVVGRAFAQMRGGTGAVGSHSTRTETFNG